MTEKRKARLDAATSRQAMQGNHRTSGNPYENHTPRGGSSQFEIAELLGQGPQNGLHLSDLVRLTGWTEREARRIIQAGGLRGVPILTDNTNR